MPRTLIMSDSTCDVPAEWVKRLDIRIVPMYVQFGQESLADDGVQLRRDEFYRRLVASPTLPTTASPSTGTVLEAMQQALSEADHVIGITAPALLSSFYNTFVMAAEQSDPARVTVIDGGVVCMAMGWEVVKAAEMAQAGASPEDIQAAVLDMRSRADLLAALDTFEYVRRGGRVGWATAMVGELFQIKPIVRMHDGITHSVTRVRTSHRAFQALVDLAHEAAPLERLAVAHTDYLEGAQRLLEAVSDIHPDHEPVIVEATPILGVHVGPHALGLGVVRQH